MPPLPGEPVRVEMTKWGERPHWEFDCCLLGSDEHGDWLGIAAGTTMSRPGASYVAPTNQLGLVPPAGPEATRGWFATFHDVAGPLRVYVDITTPPQWEGSVVRAVDLDLDVILGNSGRAWVDDEDEFADHRVRFGYPAGVVRSAAASCDRVLSAVEARRAPYDGAADAWLAHLGRRLRA